MTREEAIEFSKTHCLGNMRRKAASDEGALELWEAYMGIARESHAPPFQINRFAINQAFPAQKTIAIKNNGCARCGGTGYVAAFAHIQNGKCFSC
tara:strand:- start:308 stop:592 length:285 start_codon:yes stop_codon:yes gene_type:complete